jgi:succinate dehydrogenase hydrophobic anchor subunit
VSHQVTPDSAGRPPSLHPPEREARCRLCAVVVTVVAAVLLLMFTTDSASAASAHQLLAAGPPAAPTLDSVINGLRNWLVGLLAAVATLFLTIGGIRYITAGGDPMHVERAKTALKSAAIGYALAALAPLLVSVLRSVVG